MNRREVWGALSALVVGLANLAVGANAFADEGHEQAMPFEVCAKACADCQTQCDSCFDHCAVLVAKGDKDHVKSMRACVDCAECCKLAATLCARHSPFAAAACECCAKCNDECASACEKFPDDKHMAMCAKSCRDCAKACREMIKHLAH